MAEQPPRVERYEKLRQTDDPEKVFWDFLIVGTGVGGATIGYVLAEAGYRVLFVEKGFDVRPQAGAIAGRYVEDTPDFRSWARAEQIDNLARGGRATNTIERVDGARRSSFVPYVGSGTGGSSALFGMVMERFFPIDFAPGRAFADRAGSSLPDAWPISYEDFRPWYERAELLYRVRGGVDPFRSADEGRSLLAAPPPAAAYAELRTALAGTGLHPYRVHTAAEQVPGCRTCAAYICPFGCKNDAARICLTPALERYGAQLLTECAAIYLDADRRRVRRVFCSWRGRRIELRAKTVIVAAGALATPALLLNSHSDAWPAGLANDSGLVGRNLMVHLSDLYVLAKGPRLPEGDWHREIAFNDYYVTGSEKLGTVQSGGPAPPLSYHRNRAGLNLWRLLGPLAPLVWNPLSRRPFLGAYMEDLPYAENRVWPEGSADGYGIAVHYRLGANDRRRRESFRRHLVSVLRPFRPMRIFHLGDDIFDVTHACGTCRFGTDRHSSVLDPSNRAHGLENLYVADASFFPSSGGMNPSLTIAANALRVGDHLKAAI